MRRLTVATTPLAGLKVISRVSVVDSRGSFSRLFCQEELAAAGWGKSVAQINHSVTAHRGTVRGLHYQRPPHGEMKLVSCIRGEAWDVAVDVRAGSPTFLQWHAELLSADNCLAMLIPEGFAHGFQAMTDQVELVYCHSSPYEAQAEAGFWPYDPTVSIAWPLLTTEISKRDSGLPPIGREFHGVVL